MRRGGLELPGIGTSQFNKRRALPVPPDGGYGETERPDMEGVFQY